MFKNQCCTRFQAGKSNTKMGLGSSPLAELVRNHFKCISRLNVPEAAAAAMQRLWLHSFNHLQSSGFRLTMHSPGNGWGNRGNFISWNGKWCKLLKGGEGRRHQTALLAGERPRPAQVGKQVGYNGWIQFVPQFVPAHTPVSPAQRIKQLGELTSRAENANQKPTRYLWSDRDLLLLFAEWICI